MVEKTVIVNIHKLGATHICSIGTVLNMRDIGVSQLVLSDFLVIMPYAGILISPDCIYRIAVLITIHILRRVAWVIIGRHNLAVISHIDDSLAVMRDSKYRGPGKVPVTDILSREGHLHTYIPGLTGISEVCTEACGLRVLHRQQQIPRSRDVGIRLKDYPAVEHREIKTEII